MSNEFVLNAEPRADVGKGSSRRLRRQLDKIPAIIYGGKDQQPENITLDHKEMVKALEKEAFFSHIITINLGKKAQEVIIKDLQRHPAKPKILHADFQRVSKDVAINVHVPLHFINEESCIGVKQQGGKVSHNIVEVEVACLPADLPEFIEVDMANVELDQIVHLSDIKLPKGVQLTELMHGEDHDQPVAAIHAPKKAEEAEPTEGTVTPSAPEENKNGE